MNGNIRLKSFSVQEVFNFFNKQGDVTVRVVLNTKDDSQDKRFFRFCQSLEIMYENVRLIGGIRESDPQNVIYLFKYQHENEQFYIDPDWNLSKWQKRWRRFMRHCMPGFYSAVYSEELTEKYKDTQKILMCPYIQYAVVIPCWKSSTQTCPR